MTYKNSLLETGFGVLVGLILLPAILWGLVTWNFNNGWKVYMTEADFVSKPIFALFENIVAAPLSHSK